MADATREAAEAERELTEAAREREAEVDRQVDAAGKIAKQREEDAEAEVDRVVDAAGRIAKIREESANKAIEEARRVAEEQARIETAQVGAAGDFFGAIASIAGTARASMSEEDKEAQMLAFSIQKGAGIAQAAVNAALAISQAVASAPPPANIPAIVAAVGDEWVIHHPLGHSDLKTAMAILGGPALFLLGVTLFTRAVFRRWSASRLTGLVALAALCPFGLMMSPLALAVLTTAVMVAVATWESWQSGTVQEPIA